MGTETIEVFTYSIREKRAKEKYSFAEGIDLYEMMKKTSLILYIIVKLEMFHQRNGRFECQS